LNVIPFGLTTSGSATAEWSTDNPTTGSYSAHLETTGSVGSGNEARAVIQASDVGINTLNDLQTISWNAKGVVGYTPHVDIFLNNGKVLVFEYAKVDSTDCDDSGDYPTGEVNTFGDKGIVNNDAYAWLSSGPAGPCGDPTFDANHMSLADWKTSDGTEEVLRFEIEVDNWISQSEAYVDIVTINGTTYYGLIQDAIDAASADDTISVADGTYDEQLTVDKDVTISGVSGAILQPTGNDDAWDIQFVAGGSGATLEGFTLDFNGASDTRAGRGIGVSDFSGPAVTDVTIQNNDITMGVGTGAATVGLEGVGIQTGKDADVSGLQILNNDFHAGGIPITDGATQGEEGIYVNPNAGTGSITISDNTFDGELFTGISVEADSVTVSNNTVTRPSIVANTNGIRVNDFVTGVEYDVTISDNEVSGFDTGLRLGRTTDGGSILTITGENNIITGNNRGIWAREDSVVTISESKITSNVTVGAEILSGSDGTLNATHNWWGSSTGPTHASNPNGTGDEVSDNVLFDPWYVDEAMTILSTVGPTITLNGEATVVMLSRNDFTDPGATASDSLGANLAVTTSGAVTAQSPAGTYTITYSAIDENGLQATTTRTVIVMQSSSGGGGRGNSAGAASPQALAAVNNAGVTLPAPAGPVIGQVLGVFTIGSEPERQAAIASVKTELRSLISQLIGLLQAQLAAAVQAGNQ